MDSALMLQLRRLSSDLLAMGIGRLTHEHYEAGEVTYLTVRLHSIEPGMQLTTISRMLSLQDVRLARLDLLMLTIKEMASELFDHEVRNGRVTI